MKNISCPRCRKTFEHAQKLIKQVKSIDGKIVMGICDHCRKKAQSIKKPFCVCDEIVKKFISAYSEQKEDLKKHFKAGLPTTLKKPQQIKIRAYSDSQINQGFTSPASGHEPEVKPMFYSEKASDKILDTEIKEIGYKKQPVTFLEPIRPMGTPFGLTPHESVNGTMVPGKSFAGVEQLPRTSLKDRKQEDIFEDTPSMDAKEELKRRHDLSMRQMMGLDKDSGGPYSALQRRDVYETPKIAPWEQQKTKHNVSEIQLIHVRDSEEKPKKVKKVKDRHFKDEELQRSIDKISHKPKTTDTQLAKSKSWHKKPHKTKETIKSGTKPQFSFFFPKGNEKVEQKIKVDASSSQLIKDTQKKLNQQGERVKKRQEEQRQQKLEKEQKKRISQEEKKLQVEEKETQAVKDKKYTEKQKRQPKPEQSEKDFEIKPVGEETRQHKANRERTKEDTFEKDSKSAIKGTETKPERRDKIDKEFDKAKTGSLSKTKPRDEISDKAKTKSKPEQGRKIDELLQKTKKDKSETVQKDNDKVREQEKSVLKQEPRQKAQKEKHDTKDEDLTKKAEIMKKGSKDVKSETEKKDKIIESKTADKDKVESERKSNDVEKEQTTKMTEKERLEKIQREKEAKELIERMKQMKKLRKEIEPLEQKEQQPVIEEKKGEVKKKGKSAKQESDGPKLNAEQLKEDVLMKKKQQERKNKDVEKEQHTKTAEEERLEKIQREKEVQELAEKTKQIEQLRKEKEARKQKELEAIYKEKQAELKQKGKSSKQESDGSKLNAKELQEQALMKKKEQELDLQLTKQMEKEIKLKEKPVMLKLNDIKIQREFALDDLILALVRLKQAAANRKPIPINFEELKERTASQLDAFSSFHPDAICFGSELDVLSLVTKIHQPTEIIRDVIMGEKIVKLKHPYEKTKVSEVDDKYRKMDFLDTILPPKEIQIIQKEAEHVEKVDRSSKKVDFEPNKGILRYALSDRSFIEKGWTMLPTEKVVRKMNVYRMRPAHPEFDWFEHNKNKRLMTYDSGERLAEFDDNGRGRWYYRSGRLALDYYDAEETNAQQRFVVYSSGEPDERGRTHPITILATFDYLGNGIVFDHSGKIRLKYNQTEGVVLDRGIGPVSHWKWHTLNDPPVLQQVMIDTQMAHKDPEILKLGPASDKEIRPDNAEMLAIEFDNFIKEKSKKLSQKFKPFQIKMKALKINEHFSLRVLDQATVYLIFRDGSTNLKLNIGMILDHQEIVDTDTAEVGEVSNSLERFPARTDSLAGLQRSVAYAQRYERQRSNREARLRPAEPCASADHLTAAASRPMRLPLRTVPTGSSSSTGCCSRKPTNNLYYNTRLL